MGKAMRASVILIETRSEAVEAYRAFQNSPRSLLAFDIPRSVVIHFPEEMMNVVAPAISRPVEQVVSWVYPSNTAKQHRLVAWFGFKPDMRAVGQDYKNPNDKRAVVCASF